MEETISQQAAKELIEWMKGIREFASDQVPDVARQIAAFGAWSNGIGVVVLLVGAIISYLILRWAMRKYTEEEREAMDNRFSPAVMIFFCASLGFPAGAIACGYYFVQAVVAPKYYVLSVLGGMIS